MRIVSFMARAFIYLFFCVRIARKRTQRLAIERVLFISRACYVCVFVREKERVCTVGAATEMRRFSSVELLAGTGGTIFS